MREWPEGVEVACADTGVDTPTGGRIKLVADRIGGEPFCATYADGVADIDLAAARRHHRGGAWHGHRGSPTLQFGVAELGDDGHVAASTEKPRLERWINGGFFRFEPAALDYIDDDSVLEREPARAPRRRRPARRLPARRLLGLHGHLQGRGDAERPLGGGKSALEGLGRGARRMKGVALVTGARGFGGSWLASRCSPRAPGRLAATARATGPRDSPCSGSRATSSTSSRGHPRRRARSELIARKRRDTVFHLAAQAIVGEANASPVPTFETNIEGTWTLLEACRAAGSSASSSPPRTRPTAPTSSCPTRGRCRFSRSTPTTSRRPRPT